MKLKQLYLLILLTTSTLACSKLTYEDVAGTSYKEYKYLNTGPCLHIAIVSRDGNSTMIFNRDSTYLFAGDTDDTISYGKWEISGNKIITYDAADTSIYGTKHIKVTHKGDNISFRHWYGKIKMEKSKQ